MQFTADFSQISDVRYAEVGQQRPCTYAFAIVKDNVVFPQHKLVKCRDFLNDTIVWDDEKFTGTIWGYSFSGPYDKERTTFYMEDADYLEKHLPLFNEYEKELGISLTSVDKCGKGWLVRGDSFWQLTTIHLSWYTQVLRVLTYSELPDLKHQTKEAMTSLEGFWELPFLLKDLKITIKRNAPSQVGMHDNNGFYTELTRGHLIKTTYNEQLKQLKQCAASLVTAS